MGIGDQIIASGMACGAHERGKRVAFGDGNRILWDGNSEQIFRHNPNIAPPGSERAPDIQWVKYYKGYRRYNRAGNGRWIWNYDFRPMPGEIWLDADEAASAKTLVGDYVVIEPNVPTWKSVAPNKQWGFDRWQELTDRLIADGYEIVQPIYPGAALKLRGAFPMVTASFRHAVALIAQAALLICPEGGLHHVAAADKRSIGGDLIASWTPAIVLFGGFVPPAVTGYPMHINLTGGAEACGSFNRCDHCLAAMRAISVDEVHAAAVLELGGGRDEPVRTQSPAA